MEQQTATAEVLGVINSSPGDLRPVFDAILEKAHSLCDAAYGSLLIRADETFRALTTHGYPQALAERLRQGLRPGANHPIQRLVDGDDFAHVADLAETNDPTARSVVQLAGVRTSLFVALRKDGALLGAITAGRVEVRPFTDKEIALLQNFAAQAVIAMENARLLTETREALEQQTATSEILSVISRSPSDIRPVFEAIVAHAASLCEAEFSAVARSEDGLLHLVALNNMSPDESAAFHSLFPRQPGRHFAMGRAFIDAQPAHLADVLSDPDYDPRTVEVLQSVAGYRSFLAVPVFREGRPIGVVGCGRRAVRPFTPIQITLLETFADQAAIALENVRLFNEIETRNRDLGEALEQQTATAEVLQVINSSPGDLTPVFEAMLDRAMRLCEAAFGILLIRDGSHFQTAALHGVPPALAEFLSSTPREPGKLTAVGRMLDGEDFVHFEDMTKVAAYQSGDPRQRAFVELGGTRTYVAVALRKDGRLVGTIGAYRREVRPFSKKQIALLQNFAAQAVIAMENARLLTETREALQQQTATAEVLQVINSSPGDLAPVFDRMLEKATQLCEARFGILWTYDGERFHPAAVHGLPTAFSEFLSRPIDLADSAALGDIARARRFVHVADLAGAGTHSGSPLRRATVDLGKARTGLGVPLLKDDAVLGIFVIYRQEVRPFSEKQIALLENFAAQAVIAMENARLLTETREALEGRPRPPRYWG